MGTYPYSEPETEGLLREFAMAKGFNAWLNFELLAAGQGQIEIRQEVNDDLLQHHGFVHGGVVGALADTACSWAAATLAGDVVTSSYTLQLLAPAIPPYLRVRACVIKKTRSTASVEAKVYCLGENEAERLVANALASIAILSS
ncbi:PaaI family thioesterase [Pseudoteredinibacter isoporae]|uniref:PaaI family thioesterase n=1 Tax=Pseudoteredinibacter isoporae TaxID=570281 RepID=UPI0031031CAE